MTMVKWDSSVRVNASDTFFPNQIPEYVIMLAVATGQFTLQICLLRLKAKQVKPKCRLRGLKLSK